MLLAGLSPPSGAMAAHAVATDLTPLRGGELSLEFRFRLGFLQRNKLELNSKSGLLSSTNENNAADFASGR
jgi:hypothetical protein